MLLVQKLGEYEDLEEQGKLLKLPCKVGDTVYRISQDFHTRMEYIEKTSVEKIAIYKDGVYVHCTCKPQVKMILGLRVFFTQSEAEAKLKELRGGE